MQQYPEEISTPCAHLPRVLEQYVDDAAVLYTIRTSLVRRARVDLERLMRFDSRISAHLEGLALAGDSGRPFVDAALGELSTGSVFVAGVRAIESRSSEQLVRLYALAEADPAANRGLLGALAWVDASQLRGIVKGMLASTAGFMKLLGISACAIHRVDPGPITESGVLSDEALLRPRILRCFGELGRIQTLRICETLLDSDEQSSFWAAWSAVLLGNRAAALDKLSAIAQVPSEYADRAFGLLMQALTRAEGHGWLQSLAKAPGQQRKLIEGAGLVGDPQYIPWLIGQMNQDDTSRLAGEAFSLITGIDLEALGMERKNQAASNRGPDDDPDNPGVEMDPDEDLPWPDPQKVSCWWDKHRSEYESGVRYFMGEPLNGDNCLRVLKRGDQRQRRLAAQYLCLSQPGTILFEWRAPAWRQRRLLSILS